MVDCCEGILLTAFQQAGLVGICGGCCHRLQSWLHSWTARVAPPSVYFSQSESGQGGVLDCSLQPAARYRPLIDALYHELCDRWVHALQQRVTERLCLGGTSPDAISCSDPSSPSDVSGSPCLRPHGAVKHFARLHLRRLASIPGSSVEHNTFCISAHYRNCPGDTWQQVVEVVEDVVSRNSELKLTRGRKLVANRPKVKPWVT